MKRVRGGAGLGDAIYLRPIVEHLLAKGEQVTVCSGYPGVFDGLDITVLPFDRFNIDILAHYTTGKRRAGTSQWEDICLSAGIQVPLQFSWTVRNRELVDGLRTKAAGRPIVMVSGGRTPMARNDGFGAELLPARSAFEIALSTLDDCFLVQVGKAQQIYPLKTHISLNGSTSVTDLLDLAKIADGVVSQVSFCVPLAEVFDKPLLVVWSAEGMASARHWYVSSITPQKILSKPTSRWVVDDWTIESIKEGVRAFRELF